METGEPDDQRIVVILNPGAVLDAVRQNNKGIQSNLFEAALEVDHPISKRLAGIGSKSAPRWGNLAVEESA